MENNEYVKVNRKVFDQLIRYLASKKFDCPSIVDFPVNCELNCDECWRRALIREELNNAKN